MERVGFQADALFFDVVAATSLCLVVAFSDCEVFNLTQDTPPCQLVKRQKTALERRAEALLKTLNDEVEQLEQQWQPGNHTVFEMLYLYKPQAKRLAKRLEKGNPKTLRRRLNALKRDLSKMAGYEVNAYHIPYDPSGTIPLSRWEQRQQDAALRYAALKRLVDGLENVIRPGGGKTRPPSHS